MRIEGLDLRSLVPQISPQEQSVRAQTPFDTFLNAYMDVLSETNRLEHNALNLQMDLVTGRTDDMLAVMLAQEEAFVSLNFTVQVTNRIIEAYREIMRVAM